jgi:uncharacterized delta-60 repeat protein
MAGGDYVTIKLDTEGNQFWASMYKGQIDREDRDWAAAIALDSAGNVYVTGSSEDLDEDAYLHSDYATVKYDPDGKLLWEAIYDGPEHSAYRAYDIAVDSSGNVYVTGNSATIKYDTNSNELWVAEFAREGRAIALDSLGNVYVTGASSDNVTGWDYATAKYDANGNELWVTRYDNDNTLEQVRAIALDSLGNVYVTGSSIGDSSHDYATVKYDTDGNELWVARYEGIGGDEAYDIAVDSADNVYVTGSSDDDGYQPDYATIKYDTDGNELWVARYNGPENAVDWARDIAVDDSGSVYVTGSSGGYGTGWNYATVKYDTNGIQLWASGYNGPANNLDMAHALALDSMGNVYVTGESFGNGTYDDFATVKYDTNGNELAVVRTIGLYGGSANIAADNSGNCYMAGTTGNYVDDSDYITIKYGPGNQSPLADAGNNIQITSADQTYTALQGTGTDPDADTLDYRWLEDANVVLDWNDVGDNNEAHLDLGALPYFSVGNHTLTLEVYDGQMTSSDDMLLTIENSPPETVPGPSSQTVQIGLDPIVVVADVADFDGDELDYEWLKDGQVLDSGMVQTVQGGDVVPISGLYVPAGDPCFPVGVHQVELEVSDGINAPVSTSVSVEVTDSTAPSISPVPSMTILWPPNHELVPVTIQANAFDNGGGQITLTVIVQSSEPEDGIGDGSTEPDSVIVSVDNETGLIELQLRAERAGKGDGRTYTIVITAIDESGNQSVAIVEISAPHDRRKQ